LLIIYFFRNIKIFSVKDFKIDVNIQKYILKFGLKSYVSNLITILNYRINIFIIAHYLGSKETGIYSSCLVIIDFIWLLPATISSVTYPWFSNPSMSAQRKVMIPIITRVVIFLTFIATLLFYILGDYLVNIVFGSKFTDTRSLFLYLGPGIILMAGSKIINVDFAAQGKPQINIYLNLMALIITVISNFLLIPRFNLIGAAIATSISFIIWFSVSLLIYCKITKTRMREYLIPKINDLSFIINFKK
jgi:O-antigen/teichoic acid export membrane protein